MNDEPQTHFADYRDLREVMAHAEKGWTIPFQKAVIAALLRIEEKLDKQGD